MKIKQSTLAVLLMLSAGIANAAPVLQACNPMEVSHSSTAGISYSLHCDAGQWRLGYSGSVPAGEDAVTAHYRLSLAGPGGVELVQNRSIRLASPAMLGQMLMREAVVLESGDLALRDCKDVGCTQYRPLLGTAHKQVKSAVLVERDDIALADRQRLLTEIASLKGDLAAMKANTDKALADALQAERLRGEAQLSALRAEYQEYRAHSISPQQVHSLELQVRLLTSALVYTSRKLEDGQESQKGAFCQRHRGEAGHIIPEKRLLPVQSIRIGEPAPGTQPLPATVGHLHYDSTSLDHWDVMATGRAGRHLKNPESAAPPEMPQEAKTAAGLPGGPDAPVSKAEDALTVKPGYTPLDKAKQPKKRYLNVYGQWYDMWTTPPMPVSASAISKK